jgi:hypothetical protein
MSLNSTTKWKLKKFSEWEQTTDKIEVKKFYN